MPANASWSRDCNGSVPARWSRPRWSRWAPFPPQPRWRSASNLVAVLDAKHRASIKDTTEINQWGRSRSAAPVPLRSAAPIWTRQYHELFQVFHRPADLRGCAVDVDFRGGAVVAAGAADLGMPRSGAADGGGARAISRRQPQGHRRDGVD